MEDELAYVLGALASDGYACYVKSNRAYRVGLKVKDKEFSDEFLRCITEVTGRAVKPYLRVEKGITYHVVNKGCKWLFKLAKRVKANEMILENPREACMFLRGYYDGDGHLSHVRGNNYIVGITTVHKDRADFLLGVFNFASFYPKVYYYKHKKPWRGITQMYQLKIHKRKEIKDFMRRVGSSIPRKNVDLRGVKVTKMREIYSDEVLIERLKRAAKKLGHSPTKREWMKLNYVPSPTLYMLRFGSWNNAKEQADLEQHHRGWH